MQVCDLTEVQDDMQATSSLDAGFVQVAARPHPFNPQEVGGPGWRWGSTPVVRLASRSTRCIFACHAAAVAY